MTKYITVFIPVFNGEKYLRDCIDGVLTQKLPSGYELEVLVTDSGSRDRSVQIAKSFGERIIFDEIPNSEFGHGKTRQQAVEKARGDFVLLLTQDATPADTTWLLHMIEPFFVSEKVGCVYGRQIPRPDAVPTIKREVASVFNQFGLSNQIVIHRTGSLVDKNSTNPGVGFFSDVNSAVRKDLNPIIPFRDLAYAEDQALARDMFRKGYWVGYAPQGAVWHSNEYTIAEFRKRKFDEFIGLQESIQYDVRPSRRSLFLGWLKPTFADWSFTLKDKDYHLVQKLYYLIKSIGYNVASKRGQYEALRYINDQQKRRKLSLEQSRK